MMIQISDDYVLDEVRDGFFVPSMMKRAWLAQLKCYKVLEALCNEIGINMNATWGTLLGCIRNGGFIPWDDDIDVEMHRQDYLKLEEYVKRYSLPGRFCLSDYKDTYDFNMVKRFQDSDSPIRREDEINDFFGFPLSTMLDIFICDDIPREAAKRRRYMDLIAHATYLRDEAKIMWDERHGKTDNKRTLSTKEFEKQLKRMEKEIGVTIEREGHEPLYVRIMHAMEVFSEKYDGSLCDDVAMLTYYMEADERIIPKRLYKGYVDMPFESTTIRVPIGYDGIMRRYFGNYAYPALLYSGHAYPSYEYVEKQLRDKVGAEMLHYHFYRDEYERAISYRKKRTALRELYNAFTSMSEEAHSYMKSEVRSDKPNQVEVKSILKTCQELAIQLGNRIEESGELQTCKNTHNNTTVRSVVNMLEEYCESAYLAYQTEESEQQIEHIDKMISEEKNIKEYESIITEKKLIVFLPYRCDQWNSLNSIWKAATQDEEYVVRVIPIPYYIKEYDGSIDKKKIRLENDGYPDEVPITGYADYDFELHHPDVMIMQCPYDSFSDAISVHPFFYMENIIKYTDKLVLIPPFVLREIVPEDDRSKQTLKYFLRTPGMIYADQIVVQSGRMREVYIELLNDYLNEEKSEGAIDWESKVIGTGSAIYDDMQEKNKMKEEYREQIPGITDGKSILVFALNASMIYEYGDRAIKKAYDIINIFKLYKDKLIVVWREDPLAEKILSFSGDDLYIRYVDLEKEMVSGPDDDTLVELADAYYGDTCTVLNECRIKGVPVLWQVPDVDAPSGERVDKVNKQRFGGCLGSEMSDICESFPIVATEDKINIISFLEYVFKERKKTSNNSLNKTDLQGNGNNSENEIDYGEKIWKDIR